MNKVVKEEWLQALRSGEYTQGFNYLSNQGRYCCLGVLCEIATKHEICEKNKIKEFYDSAGEDIYDDRNKSLPISVAEWAEIEGSLAIIPEPVTIGQYKHGNLAFLNDNGMTFLEIADIIEEQL